MPKDVMSNQWTAGSRGLSCAYILSLENTRPNPTCEVRGNLLKLKCESRSTPPMRIFSTGDGTLTMKLFQGTTF